ALRPELAEVGEHLVPHQRQHGLAAQLGEVLPAQLLLVGAERTAERLAGVEPAPLPLLGALADVGQASEGEERDLLDDRQRIGDATRPELLSRDRNPYALRGHEVLRREPPAPDRLEPFSGLLVWSS